MEKDVELITMHYLNICLKRLEKIKNTVMRADL
jgi:hypothetical protein